MQGPKQFSIENSPFWSTKSSETIGTSRATLMCCTVVMHSFIHTLYPNWVWVTESFRSSAGVQCCCETFWFLPIRITLTSKGMACSNSTRFCLSNLMEAKPLDACTIPKKDLVSLHGISFHNSILANYMEKHCWSAGSYWGSALKKTLKVVCDGIVPQSLHCACHWPTWRQLTCTF